MRIAYICVDAGIPFFGQKGASIHAGQIIRGFLKRGMEVEVFCSRIESQAPAELERTRLQKIASFPAGTGHVSTGQINQANGDLRSALEARGRFDIVYERYSLWSFAALEWARQQAVPGLLEVNAPLIEEQERYRILEERPLAERIAKQSFSLASNVIAVSQEVADYVAKYLENGAKGKIYVVPNAVNPERFSPKKDWLNLGDKKTFTVGFVGSLKPWHGVMNLIEAFKILYQNSSDSRLLIIGDGPEREGLLKQVSEAGLKGAVSFTGMISFELVPEYLASMDAAVAPYPALTSFYFSPLKIFEYMAAGLPVVASDIGQVKQIIQHEENGLLVSPGNAVALAEALERLRCDTPLCMRLGENGRRTILAKYTWDNVISRILKIAGF